MNKRTVIAYSATVLLPLLLLLTTVISKQPDTASAQTTDAGMDGSKHVITQDERQAAADRAQAAGLNPAQAGTTASGADTFNGALATPDYFGSTPNYANSPLPTVVPGSNISFSPMAAWASGPTQWDWNRSMVADGDFDGDGKVEVGVLYNYGGGRTGAWMLKADGNGTTLSARLSWLTGWGQWDWSRSKLAAGDFDGDGMCDLGVLYDYGNGITGAWILKSDGTTFTPLLAWQSAAGQWDWSRSQLAAGDFDADGKSDLGVLYDYGNGLTGAWMFKSGGSTFTPSMAWQSYPNPGYWEWGRSKLAAGDFDADGKSDLGVLYNYGNLRTGAWILKSDGTSFTPSLAWLTNPGEWDWNRSLLNAGDFNGDGKGDLGILYNYGNSTTGAWVLKSSGTTFNAGIYSWLSGPGQWEWWRSMLSAGDFDGDGMSDFGVLYNYGNATTKEWTLKPSLDTTIAPGTGIRKFVDTLPGLGAANANNLGKFMPVAVPDTTSYPGTDYYEISVREYTEQMHSDLPGTKLRGYVQTNNGTDQQTGENTVAPAPIHYLGPVIVAHKDKAVRIKFTNELPTGSGGDLFVPVDTTIMGAGPYEIDDPMNPGETISGNFTQNRATLHLHGGDNPWISDGTPHQWITPAGESTNYPKGMSVQNVPDMPVPPNGSMTFYFPNQQSARMMFYHDHAYGITRLNVYAGEAAGYLIQDDTEQQLVNDNIIPADQIPLVIQDKTFVPDTAQLNQEDPTWDTAKYGGKGSLWLPHVYMPAQNPADPAGMNAMGRWHYGPYFHPPTTNITYPPVANPLYDCYTGGPCTRPWEPSVMPATPNPSIAPEAFVDTPVVNGQAYPTLNVEPKSYRLRILNAANDRFWNLQLYKADPAVTSIDGRTNTEVKMVPALATHGFPASWPTDGRAGGVPDPATAGPQMIQIGTEGGFLPAPVVLPNQPVDWNRDMTTFNFGNVTSHTLLLGPAERGDVIVDFSKYAGQTLILYNDAPAAFPALDPRYDYFTGAPDLTSTGGAPTPLAGYGPNTRTIMQIKVAGTAPAPEFDINALNARFASTGTTDGVFAASQDPIIVPQPGYNSAYNGNYPDVFAGIADNSITFTPRGSGTPLTIPFVPKAIQDEMGEAFEKDYGRMSADLGTELLNTNATNKNFVLQDYIDPPTELLQDNMTPMSPVAGDGTQIWKITHNGVDTHTLHFHLFNVQIINRVAWDNKVMMPDANELGWKETIRVNPLEDMIVAMRPVAPTLPFEVPGSVRPLDVTRPLGSTMGFTSVDPYSGEPRSTPTVNQMYNFGWEYVLHCHLLGHEENDMMRPVRFSVNPPAAPSGLTAQELAPGTVTLNWVNNATTPAATTFVIESATNDTFTAGRRTFTVNAPTVTYADAVVLPNTTYYYRVRAENATGFSNWSASASVTTGP